MQCQSPHYSSFNQYPAVFKYATSCVQENIELILANTQGADTNLKLYVRF